MKNLLAIETSHATCSVALQTSKQNYFQSAPAVLNGTNQILLLVSQVLQQAHLSVRDLSAIAWDHGPGSFTGLRVGAAAVQGLALPFNTPLIPVSGLAATVRQASLQNSAPYIGVILNAHGGHAYVGWYQSDGFKSLQAETLLPQSDIQPPDDKPWVLVSDLQPEQLHGLAALPYSGIVWPNAEDILFLAHSKNATQLAPDEVQPNYLNLPEYRRA